MNVKENVWKPFKYEKEYCFDVVIKEAFAFVVLLLDNFYQMQFLECLVSDARITNSVSVNSKTNDAVTVVTQAANTLYRYNGVETSWHWATLTVSDIHFNLKLW